MNILFDHQIFDMQLYGGISRFFTEIAAGLQKQDVDVVVGVKESDNIYLNDRGLVKNLRPAGYRKQLWFGHPQYFHGENKLKRFLLKSVGCSLNPNADYCLRYISKNKQDVFHPTFYDSYFIDALGDKPFVLTVHDMMPELFPQHFDRDDFQIVQKKFLCPKASYIHVPSFRTKEDLINILGIPQEKVIVIPHGYRAPDKTASQSHLFIERPFILYVGERNVYKNFTKFIREASNVVHDFPEIQIICTGRDFNAEEIRLFDSLRIGASVKHIFASEADMSYLYQSAIAFVYPSAYEGFGLPILEAFANKCPVMLNDASCFPEVAEDAAIYFDMNKKDSGFYDEFVHLYKMSSEERSRLIEKGTRRLRSFSWDITAKAMKSLYQKCL